MPEVTELLNALCHGQTGENDPLVSVVWSELRKIAGARLASESAKHTLQPTALVNEVFVRLLARPDETTASAEGSYWQNRSHFYGAASEAMRRILVDHARKKKSQKRGGNAKRLQGVDDLCDHRIADYDEILDVNDALEQLEQAHPEKARLVKLRYFVGMTIPQAAEIMDISTATANRYWAFARAWLYERIHHPTA